VRKREQGLRDPAELLRKNVRIWRKNMQKWNMNPRFRRRNFNRRGQFDCGRV
jgi:hypothetical protein